MEFSVSEAVSIAMVGRSRSTRIVLFCAVVAMLLPYCVGITCCKDPQCEETENCKPEFNVCMVLSSPYRDVHWCEERVIGADTPTTCVGKPTIEECICTTDRCNIFTNSAPGGAPGGAPGAAPLPAPPPPAPKSAANPMMLNVELLLVAAVIKLLKFVL